MDVVSRATDKRPGGARAGGSLKILIGRDQATMFRDIERFKKEATVMMPSTTTRSSRSTRSPARRAWARRNKVHSQQNLKDMVAAEGALEAAPVSGSCVRRPRRSRSSHARGSSTRT